MAVRGRVPKDDAVHRNQLVHDWVEVPDVPYRGKKPALPRHYSKGTHDWWKAVSTMPHCVLWGDSEWAYAVTTARMYERMVSEGDNARASIITKREAVMGMTLDARRAQRIRYVNPKAFETPITADTEGEAAAPDPMADFEAERRRRLLNAP